MANSSFFQNAVEKANKKPATTVERLTEAYNNNTQRGSTSVETPVLDSAVKQNSKQAFSPASSLEEFMGILPTPEVKNDGLDGTPYADMVRSEWKRMGVDNAYDYGKIARDYTSRSIPSGVLLAGRDSVNYLYNIYQQAKNNIAKRNQYATGDELLYQDVLKKTGEEYKDKPLEKAVDWGEAYDAESERIAKELNVNEEARKDYQFGQALGRMAPAIAVSATGNLVGGGMTLLGAADAAKTAFTIGRVLSSAATFTSAAGGAYEDAKAHGIDDDKAMTYATTVGAIELATESISSGLGKLGGKAIGTGGFTDDFVSSLAKKVSSDPNVQNAVIYAGGVLGEGFEEWLSEWGDYAANRLLVKYDDRTLKDVWGDSKESFMQGAMMSSLLNITQLMQRGVPPKEAIRQGVDETAAEADISPTAEQQRSTEPSAQNGQTAKETPTTFSVEDMLKNPVNLSQANRIINDANLRAEYEAYTGEKLPTVKSEAAKAVMEYSRNHAELTPMAQVVLNQRAETAPVPETQTGTVSPAEQTMARAAAQNAVQESAPARTDISPATQPEVSPAARTMADVLTGKSAEAESTQTHDFIDAYDNLQAEYERRSAAYMEATKNNDPNYDYLHESQWLSAASQQLETQKGRYTQALQTQRYQQGQTSKAYGTAENHINARDYQSVADRNVKAFQFDYPELHQYYAGVASLLYDEVNSQQAFQEGTRTYNPKTGKFYTRPTTSKIIEAMQPYGITKNDLQKALSAIMQDSGQENYAAAKRVELFIDDLLTNGGEVGTETLQPNAEYINAKRRITGGVETEKTKAAKEIREAYEWDRAPEEEIQRAIAASNAKIDAETASLTSQNGENTGKASDASAHGGETGQRSVRDNITPQNATGTPPGPDTPTRLSQTVETVRDAAVTPDAVKQSINENIENGGYRYIPESNADAVASARASIKENGYDSVLRSWTEAVARGKTSNDLFATGAVLYNEAIQSGNTKLALDILSDYQLLGTNTAQGLQAASIIKNLTPDGQLYIMQKDVKKLNDSRSETAKRKNPEGYKIDPDLADAFINAKDDAARDAAVTAIQQDIASQIPASFAEKWRALRYLNMLGNVKTQARNILGNTAMMGLTGAKNTMLTGIEYLANKLSGGKYERNTAFGVRDYMDAAKKYYKTVDDFVNGDSKYMESNMNDSFSRGVQDARKIFGFKPLEAYRKATQWAMTQGDVLFIRPQFARSLSGYLKARGMDANTFTQIVNGDIQATAEQQDLIHNATEYAAREAQEATFHDSNAISDAVSKVGKGWPAPVRAIFEGILPFRKTPANVLVRAEEYSPLGVVNTAVNAYQAAKGLNGKTAADVINSFSKTATGTSLFALGALLAKAGLARGKEDDEEQEAFDKLQGKQDFSVVLPDGSSYTMDWLSPAAVPFFMGVAFSDAMSDGDITIGEFLKAIDTLTEPMVEMSMLQGVNDALDQIKYSDNALVNFALNQMVNYVSQAIGNTLYGQIERITEKNRETTYTASDTPEGRTWERTFGKIMNKLPGEYNQVEYVDAWGRTQSNGSVAERAFSNLLSPGYIGKNNSTEVDNELQRLYDAGQTNVFPSRIAMTQTVNVYRNDGRKIEDRRLTKDEYVQYQKVMGQTSLELVKDLMKSPVYNGMSDEAKADAISEIYGYAKRMAAMAVEPSAKYGEKTDVSKLSNPAAYYAAKASYSAASKDSENRNYAELDSLTASFNRLPSDVRDAVINGNSGLAKLLDARENGYTSRQYYNVYDTVKALTPAEGYDNVATWQKIGAVCSMNVSDKEKDYFVMNYFEGSTKDKYTAAREAGYSPYSVAVAYQTFQLSKGVDRNGDGRNDNGTKKAAFISAMMEQGSSRKSAEWLYNLFK